jgi:putative Holliday junction resolvase
MIGVAICDAAGIVARPLTTFRHTARAQDAAQIVALAQTHEAEGILIGLALDAEGNPGPQARHTQRLADAIREQTTLPILTHDESHSTQTAQTILITLGKKRRDRREQVHAVAAAAILQSYLDAHSTETTPPPD